MWCPVKRKLDVWICMSTLPKCVLYWWWGSYSGRIRSVPTLCCFLEAIGRFCKFVEFNIFLHINQSNFKMASTTTSGMSRLICIKEASVPLSIKFSITYNNKVIDIRHHNPSGSASDIFLYHVPMNLLCVWISISFWKRMPCCETQPYMSLKMRKNINDI